MEPKTALFWLAAVLLVTPLAWFTAEHRRLPVGSGEVINWMIGR